MLHNVGRVVWGSGPRDQAPEYTGWAVIIVHNGRIAALYVLLNEATAEFSRSAAIETSV